MSDIKIEPHHDSEGTEDDFFDDIRGRWAQMEAERRETDEFKVNNMEYDMSQADWFLSKVRGSDNYAQNLYAALCNNQFQKQDVWLVLKDQHWSCSVGVMLVVLWPTFKTRVATTWIGTARALVPRTTLSLWAKATSPTKFVQIWHCWVGV
jgi:hypothetical protein